MSVSDRLAALLLVLCLAVVALLASFVAEGARPEAAGGVHPVYSTLLVGGDGAARSAGTLVRGWAYGALAIAFFATSFALAVQRPGLGLGPIRRPFWVLTLLYQLAWVAFMLAYRDFVAAPDETDFLLSFPLSTALMLYVLWPLPALYMVLYLLYFRRFVWTERDQESMDRLVAFSRGTASPDDD